MKLSFNKANALNVLKVAAFIGASYALDFVISQSTPANFGELAPFINVLAVALRELIKNREN